VRWERDSEAMAAALARHDALMRAALEAWGAYVFKTIGDAFCATFATASEAINAALDAQRALGLCRGITSKTFLRMPALSL
jgi:class 3 adenylate cyclase